MTELDEYPCAVCGKMTTRINIIYEQPSCCITCDGILALDEEEMKNERED